MNIDERLKDQNNGASWRDCNEAGMPHRWKLSTMLSDGTSASYRCTRCPVTTIVRDALQSLTPGMHGVAKPRRWLA